MEAAHDEVGKAEEMGFARDLLSNQFGVAVRQAGEASERRGGRAHHGKLVLREAKTVGLQHLDHAADGSPLAGIEMSKKDTHECPKLWCGVAATPLFD
jgi:hypothetical protein